MPLYPTGPPICGSDEDLTCKVRITSATEVELLIVYAYWGLNLLSFTIFAKYKIRELKHNPVNPFIVTQGHAESERMNTEEEKLRAGEKGDEIRLLLKEQRSIRFTGYTQIAFGTYCCYLALLTSAHWIVLWMVLLIDTYNKCEVRSIDNLCFYGNYFIFGSYEVNGTTF